MKPYQVLEIQKDAPKEEVKKAYRKLVKKYHPDRYQNESEKKEAEEKFLEIKKAYEILIKENKFNYEKENKKPRKTDYNYIKNLIKSGYYEKVLKELDEQENRNSQWFYFYGKSLCGIKNFSRGIEYIITAIQVNVDVEEYRTGLAEEIEKADKSCSYTRTKKGTEVLLNVASYLNMERKNETAFQILNIMKQQTAEWYFLHGITCYYLKKYEQSFEDLQMAVEMEPENNEYKEVKEVVKNKIEYIKKKSSIKKDNKFFSFLNDTFKFF